MRLKKYLPEITVFVCGAAVMIYELLSTRILGPYFGTSLYVWTNIIGIFLGSLSLGYYLGGKLADSLPRLDIVSYLVFSAGVSIGITFIVKEPVLQFVSQAITVPGLGSAIASVLLFLSTSLLLGMVSPFVGKLKIIELKYSGRSLGSLYALATCGSIVGTYAAGFWLIPYLGTNALLLLLSSTLILLSLLISRSLWLLKISTLLLVCAGFPFLYYLTRLQQARNFVDIDTAYNRVWIYQGMNRGDSRTIRMMGINAENHSSMFVDSPELVNEYTNYFHLARHFAPGFETALMLGGAGYSYPKDYLQKYPQATLDVVEIDPGVTTLAREYFNLQEDTRLRIFHQDARVYLNQTDKKYDVIFSDAFSSRYAPPFHLTTHEAVKRMYEALSDKGIVIANLITSIEGEKSQFFRAEYKTFASLFPQVYTFTVTTKDGGAIQNVILVAIKSNSPALLTSPDPTLQSYLENIWKKPIEQDLPILTDDYAPVEHYINSLM